MDFSARRKRLAAAMEREGLPALLVTHAADVRWVCGFTGSNAAVVVLAGGRRLQLRLFTDGRYTAQARLEVEGATVRIATKSALGEAVMFAAGSAAGRCGYDASTTTVATLATMRKVLKEARVKVARSNGFLVAGKAVVAGLREIKDAEEIGAMRRAAALGSALYEGMLGWITVGMREVEVAAELEYRARRAGAEGMSFETIVAGGVRSAMPHARATEAVLEAGTLLTLDFGVVLEGYCSDMTRTVSLGGEGAGGKRGEKARRERESEQGRVFLAVLEAQVAAVRAVRAGVSAGAVDEAARAVLRRHGLGRYFSHSTGHGVGLEIHEGPRIAAKQEAVLEAGMVVTIEPGAYLPGAFGVRIEDTVVVEDEGCEILTQAHKGWMEL